MGHRVDHGHGLTEAERFEIQRRVSNRRDLCGRGRSRRLLDEVGPAFPGVHGRERPPGWKRSPRHLSLAEREHLLRGLLAGIRFGRSRPRWDARLLRSRAR